MSLDFQVTCTRSALFSSTQRVRRRSSLMSPALRRNREGFRSCLTDRDTGAADPKEILFSMLSRPASLCLLAASAVRRTRTVECPVLEERAAWGSSLHTTSDTRRNAVLRSWLSGILLICTQYRPSGAFDTWPYHTTPALYPEESGVGETKSSTHLQRSTANGNCLGQIIRSQ